MKNTGHVTLRRYQKTGNSAYIPDGVWGHLMFCAAVVSGLPLPVQHGFVSWCRENGFVTHRPQSHRLLMGDEGMRVQREFYRDR